jgi:anaerobic ribonucleoside-triphosphate reductase
MKMTFLKTKEDGLNSLVQSFNQDFVEIINSISQEMLGIEALDRESFDISKRVENYHYNASKLAGEENANVGSSIHPSHRGGKLYEGFDKIKGYHMLFERLVKLFGLDNAKKSIKELLENSLAINDSGNIDIPYCIAISSSHLMKNGRNYIHDVPNVAPSNSRSYMSVCTETLFDLSGEHMGATVIFDIMIGLAYYTKQERQSRSFSYRSIGFENAILIGASEISSMKRDLIESTEIIRKNCTDSEQVADYVTNYIINNLIQAWVHMCGNKFRHHFQSMFTNLNLYSPRVLADSFKYYEYPNKEKVCHFNEDGSVDWSKKEYIKEILEIQKIFAKFFSQGIRNEKGSKVVAMPVVTLVIPNDEEGAEDLKKMDQEYVDMMLGLFHKYNNINVYRGLKLAMCCRLLVEKSNTVDVNSFGVKTNMDNGNQAVGSNRVVTLGMSSIALEAIKGLDKNDTNSILDNFYTIFSEKLRLSEEILYAQRTLVYDRDEEGMFRFSKVGWIDYTKLASTYGGLGLYECVKILHNRPWGSPYERDELITLQTILKMFDQKAKDSTKKYGCPFNIEVSIPGESMAMRFAKRERVNYPEFNEYKELSNQFVPLTLNCDMMDRLKWEDYLSSQVDPTGILHFNIDGELEKDQNIRIHRTIHKNFPHISHYALSGTIYYCENGHDFMRKLDDCPYCSGRIVDSVCRSIGYLKSTHFDFGAGRKDEWKRRVWNGLQEI